jgi:circadian clock protein KaiB
MDIDLRLYVSLRSARSSRAIEVGRRLHQRLQPLGGRCDILDVSQNPELADEDRILATPTLVRRQPEPLLRIIGDMDDLERLVDRLDLPPEIITDEDA